MRNSFNISPDLKVARELSKESLEQFSKFLTYLKASLVVELFPKVHKKPLRIVESPKLSSFGIVSS